jgi:hypothetical protein
MRFTRLRWLPAAAVTAVALLAITASSAFAAPNWNTTASGIKWNGSLTVTVNGGSAKTCSFDTMQGGSKVSNPAFYELWGKGLSADSGVLAMACVGGGYLTWQPYGNVTYNSGYKLSINDFGNLQGVARTSPWGTWTSQAGITRVVPFANGSATTNSSITFNNTQIGVSVSPVYGYAIRATGTLTVTTNTGGRLFVTGT